MELQGRNLRFGMKGEDVRQLQNELRQLGYDIEDADGFFGKSTRLAVLDFQKTHGLPENGEVNKLVAAAMTEQLEKLPSPSQDFVVRGKVVHADGKPGAGLTVRAFDKELRGEKLLGEAMTDPGGEYEISYSAGQLSKENKKKADLVVRAFDRTDKEIANSPVIIDAPAQTQLDLVYGNEEYRGPAEFTVVDEKLVPLLDNTKPGELTSQDIDYLAAKTNLKPSQISQYTTARANAAETGLPPQLFYGLARQGLPANLAALLAQDSRVQKRALENAVRKNIVPGTTANALEDHIGNLQKLKVKNALDGTGAGTHGLGALLDTVGLTRDRQEKFTAAYLEHKSSPDTFWEEIRKDPDFADEGVVEDIRFTLQVGGLTLDHLPMVKELRRRKKSGNIASFQDLARLDTKDWKALINKKVEGKRIGTPPGVPGKTQAQKTNNYAARLDGIMEAGFPTTRIAGRLARTNNPAQKDVTRFLEANPDFDFGKTNIDVYLGDNSRANLEGIVDKHQLGLDLKSWQRVYRLTPTTGKYDASQSMLDAGLDSANSVLRLSETQFVAAYSNQLGGEESAAVTYSNAGMISALALILFIKYYISANNLLPQLFGVLLDKLAKVPNWKTLFGPIDFCDCKHCRSVYSPAAYLVDLLQFLGKYDSKTPGRTALDVLLTRRPGIAEIELSCENTNTLLPYIDLVIEILENFIVGEVTTYQTTWTEEELSANAEHINEDAYGLDHVGGAVYPWDLPFNLWLEEGRTYLNHLEVPLHELLDAFAAIWQFPGEDTVDVLVAIDYLGISLVEARIINGKTLIVPRSPWEFWGQIRPNWINRLANVNTFLKQSGLTFDELLDLLATETVNADGHLSINFGDRQCNIAAATIENLGEPDLDIIHRFVRLQRKVGWSTWELDQVYISLSSNNYLISISHIKRIREKFNLTVIEILGWWAPLNTRANERDPQHRSLYETTFLNNAVLNPVDEAFVLNAAGDELQTIGLISEHTTALTAGLGISTSDLDLLTATVVTDDVLNLANLSQLYRVVSLANALNLSIDEFITAWMLLELDPFDGTHTANTLAFIEQVEAISCSQFEIAELDYLLRHKNSGDFAPTEESMILILDEIRGELQTIVSENQPAADPTGEITRSKLAIVFDDETLNRAVAIITDPLSEPRADRDAFLTEHFSAFLDVTELIDFFNKYPGPEYLQQRYEFILEPLLLYIQKLLGESFVVQKMADTLGLDVASTELLLTRYVYVPGKPGVVAIDAFMALGEHEGDYPNAIFELYTLLDKIAMILIKFSVTSEEIPWLFENGPALGWLDFNALPLKEEIAAKQYPGWLRLYYLFEFRDKHTTGDETVFNVLNLAQTGEPVDVVLGALNTLTGWDREDLVLLTGNSGFNFTFPDDYTNELYLLRLDRCFTLLDKLGTSAGEIMSWQFLTQPMETARRIKQTARAKYDDETWLSIAKPLKDSLREKQRKALVSYVVANVLFVDKPSDIYENALIDAEMSACFMTSRIKFAISSVQLFIQICLMNLEPLVELPGEAAGQWEWMKNYRVWEAARKVFLYPENWIEPDLRQDKSEFFSQLENNLMKSELSSESCEKALGNYLRRLDEVSHLEIVGVYHQVEEATADSEAVDVLHVIGRTRNDAHIYYYRQRVDESRWTAWEKMDVDIEGNHVLPVFWNNSLYVFWFLITESSYEEKASDNAFEDETVTKGRWEIKLAWVSRKYNDNWSVKKTTEEPFIPDFHNWHEDESIFYFQSRFDQDDLLIDCQHQHDIGESPWAETSGNFRILSCNEKVLFEGIQWTIDDPILPLNSQIESMQAREEEGEDHALELASGDTDASGNFITGTEFYIPTVNRTPGTFSIAYPHQFNEFVSQAPCFYQDDNRSFFITPEVSSIFIPMPHIEINFFTIEIVWVKEWVDITRFFFQMFYHPYVCDFRGRLNRDGVNNLLQRSTQSQLKHFFVNEYIDGPDPGTIKRPVPVEDVDFSPEGAYSSYNWELFFHIPLLMATRLSQNQKFEEAQKWFHYIFNPLAPPGSTLGPERYWNFYPFYLESGGENILDLMNAVAEGDADAENQVKEWRSDPFNPHLLARLRPMAYQKTVVMKYIDNLIAWGDQLFRQDTIESINEATHLYILAANILGDRPETVAGREAAVQTFNSLKDNLDDFSNALVEMENLVAEPGSGGTDNGAVPSLVLYFCIPPNDKLLGYWDTVDDRLFKIRHCMNIEGLVRQLPLFQPPIEPGLLVKAAAAGVDISSAINDLFAPLPHYRFQVILQKAIDFVNEVKSLGTALLAAMEKRDSEGLAVLRASQEVRLLDNVRQIKEQQIEEAGEALQGLTKMHELVEQRRDYYKGLLDKGLNPEEKNQLHLLELADGKMFWSDYYALIAARAFKEADLTVSLGIPPNVKVTETFGGSFKGQANQAKALEFEFNANANVFGANMDSIRAGQIRRSQEWDYQCLQAEKELEQIDKQILAAEIRRAIAEKELENHDKQIENSKSVETFMKDKFTNQELYDWMVSQISSIYFQSYQMAYDLAKKAEEAFRHEIGDPEATFIRFGYWDSLKKGLLSGEKLNYDLKRMEVAYLDKNKREYEITRHVSMAVLDPIALVKFKQTGQCFLNIPEEVFDLDYPDQYMRRIKSVSLTIPGVTGPYTSINCKLTLLSNRIRKDTSTAGGYAYRDIEDARFHHNIGAIQSIATSRGQNDSGLFELDFRDERYLPFEGAGVISDWRLELPDKFRRFNYDTISDVIFHIQYTARDGGEALKNAAITALEAEFATIGNGLTIMFSARHEFPGEWHRFLYPTGEETIQVLDLDLRKERFPFMFKDKVVDITKVVLFLQLKDHLDSSAGAGLEFLVTDPGETSNPIQVNPNPNEYGDLLFGETAVAGSPGSWSVHVNTPNQDGESTIPEDLRSSEDPNRLSADAIENIIIVCEYSAAVA